MATCSRCSQRFNNAMQLGAHMRVCAEAIDDNVIITQPVTYSLQDLARRPPQPWGESRAVHSAQIVNNVVRPISALSRDYREVRR